MVLGKGFIQAGFVHWSSASSWHRPSCESRKEPAFTLFAQSPFPHCLPGGHTGLGKVGRGAGGVLEAGEDAVAAPARPLRLHQCPQQGVILHCLPHDPAPATASKQIPLPLSSGVPGRVKRSLSSSMMRSVKARCGTSSARSSPHHSTKLDGVRIRPASSPRARWAARTTMTEMSSYNSFISTIVLSVWKANPPLME